MHSTKTVILHELTVNDADIFYKIYSNPLIVKNFDENPFLQNETPAQYTERIISSCNYIYTIRPADNPNLIIGDCALHHWDNKKKEIFIGGSLFPEYWGLGYMKDAFGQLIKIAKQELRVNTILGQTKTRNTNAIRFVEKIGFKKHQSDEQNTTMRKEI